MTDPPSARELVASPPTSKSSGPLRKMVTGVVLFVAICTVAVTGYVASGWRLDDSIYMVIITIFGVGYGEVQPVQSLALRALTIAVIIGGYGAVIYTIGGFMVTPRTPRLAVPGKVSTMPQKQAAGGPAETISTVSLDPGGRGQA